jgi:hypothetical protein
MNVESLKCRTALLRSAPREPLIDTSQRLLATSLTLQIEAELQSHLNLPRRQLILHNLKVGSLIARPINP